MKTKLLIIPLFLSISLSFGGNINPKICIEKSCSRTDSIAARYLSRFLGEATKKSVSITDTPCQSMIYIKTDSTLEEDSFIIKTEGKNIIITGAPQKGTIYGALTFLRDFLHMEYYSNDFYILPECKDLVISDNYFKKEVPSFKYRQSGAGGSDIFIDWNRLESPRKTFAGGLWVHTMNAIMPADKYGKSHPEYYALINGERRPGRQSSWCLTNPSVLEIATHYLDSIFKAHPECNIISVSQNDGNGTNCTCEKCAEIDRRNGGPSGSLIWFINKLAERFPDKQISTLAYLHTMHPPKEIVPRDNVNIMLCDIDCMRQLPLTETPSGKEFVEALNGWAKISNNIFLWDYAINFHHYMSLFPNFHILQPNIKLAKENGVTMFFEQSSGGTGVDLTELRLYLTSHLLWDHNVNVDSLTRNFCKGYYGKASDYIYDYIKLREGALIGSGNTLWIYDSPASHADDDMRPFLREKYQELFDRAENAVKDDSARLAHVQIARLAIQYSELEILRTIKDKPSDMKAKVDFFEERTKKYKVSVINEGGTKPETYITNYRKRYLPDSLINLAQGTKVQYLIEPTGKYQKIAAEAMTDGLLGGGAFRDSWIGWEGTDCDYILDLGKDTKFKTISVDFLQMLGDWVFFPKSITAEYSTDKSNFQEFGHSDIPESHINAACYYESNITSSLPITARYIKIHVEATKKCPNWHFGVGHKSWCFIDETRVRP